MSKTNFDLEMFQAEVDRILLAKARPGETKEVCSGAIVRLTSGNSTCDYTAQCNYDILPAKVRPTMALLQRMLRLSQLPSEQRQELQSLDVQVRCLIRWYQQKKIVLHCAPYSESSQKLNCFFQYRAADLANRIEAHWVLLERQVKQQEQADCQRYILQQKQERLRRLLELEPDNEEWLAELSRINSQRQFGPVHRAYLCQTYENTVQRKAQEIIARKDILALLSMGLSGISGDVFEISKVITPILAVLAITDTVAIPLVPALFASIALLLSRKAITAHPTNYDTSRKSNPYAPRSNPAYEAVYVAV